MKVTQGELKRWVSDFYDKEKPFHLKEETKLVMILETKYGYGWVKVVEVATGEKTSVLVRNLEETWRRG